MLRTRWRKVLLDLWGHKARTILVILAITVGVFSVGFIASAQAILLRELAADYEGLRAASATLYTQPFDQDLVDSIAALPDVETAEGRRGINGRILTRSGEWRNVTLNVIADYDEITLDRILPVAGAWPPQRQEMVVERLSLDYLGAELGDVIQLELPDGTLKELAVSGLAFDNRVPSADVTGRAFGYISRDTMARLGLGTFFTELRFRVAEKGDDLAHIQQVTADLEEKIERSGREVFATSTPPPGEHWAEDIIATLVLLFFVFGGIIMFLSGFLVINTVTALITQQIQQIGIMKLVGAKRLQIMSMYIAMVLLYGLIALALGIPAGIFMGRAAVDVASELLNVTVNDRSVPLGVILVQAAVGLLIPLLAALWPVLSGVKISTQRALSSSGVDGGGYGQGVVERGLTRLQNRFPMQRTLILPIRNTIRRKGRLILTLMILIMGTALFISVLTVRDSVAQTLENFLRYHRYDVGLTFDRPYRADQLRQVAVESGLVDAAEAWLQAGTRRLRPDGSESDGYQVIALPPDTRLIEPLPESGRWLTPADSNGIVVNTFFMGEEQDVRLGDEITLRVNGRDLTWEVVGVVPAPADGGTRLYVNYDYYAYVSRQVGRANTLQLLGRQELETTLLEYFGGQGYQVTNSTTEQGVREEFYLRFNIVILFLVVMAILLGIVGGLGLTTTMSINVLERIREIGVLRAIGASNRSVRQIVIAEGLAVGLVSWLVGVVLSVPLSILLSNQVGLALLRMPLDYRYSVFGAFGWLVILIILAAAASLGPARSASKLTIREVLAYD